MGNKSLQQKRLKELVKEYTEKTGCRQQDVAELIGYASSYLSKILIGKTNMSFEFAQNLIFTIAPDVRLPWLIGFDDWKTDDDYLEDMLEQRGLIAVPKTGGEKNE